MDTPVDRYGLYAESFYPMGWLERPFGRKPYPDMTYGEAIDAAYVLLWNMHLDSVPGAGRTADLLKELLEDFQAENTTFPGRSLAQVHAFANIWRGPVMSLLTWFHKQEEG